MEYTDFEKIEAIERRYFYPRKDSLPFRNEAERDIHTLLDMLHYQAKIIRERDEFISERFRQ